MRIYRRVIWSHVVWVQVHLKATPALRKWLQRFDRLLWSISADAPAPDVATQALGIASIARDSKEAALRCAAAAAAAEDARRTAEAAAEHAKQAQQATAATVRELLLAKRAEVEAEQLIRQQVCSCAALWLMKLSAVAEFLSQVCVVLAPVQEEACSSGVQGYVTVTSSRLLRLHVIA